MVFDIEREPDGVRRDGAAGALGDAPARSAHGPEDGLKHQFDAALLRPGLTTAPPSSPADPSSSVLAADIASAVLSSTLRADQQHRASALFELLESLTGAAGWVLEAGASSVTPTVGLIELLKIDHSRSTSTNPAQGPELPVADLVACIAPPDRLRSIAHLRRTLRSGAPSRFELSTSSRCGGARLELSAARYQLASGSALVGVAIDVSERYRLIGSLSDAARTAFERVEAAENRLPPAPVTAVTHRTTAFGPDDIDALAQVASHDFQGKVRKILFYADLVKRGYSCSNDANGVGAADEIAGFIETIIRDATTMREQINDLSRFADIVSAPLKRQDLLVSDIVQQTMTDLHAELSACAASVMHEGDVVINADPALLSGALGHLIRNAVQFRRSDRPEIRISARHLDSETAESGWSRISVADNGTGFDPAHADRIFDLFTRLSAPSDGKPQPLAASKTSTGVGLAICASVARRHGGRIWAQTSPGAGASFHLDLPNAPHE